MSSFKTDDPSLRDSRHARLFGLFRSENTPPDVESAGRKLDSLSPDDALRIQKRAIASLNPGTPSRRRIFRKSRSGLLGV